MSGKRTKDPTLGQQEYFIPTLKILVDRPDTGSGDWLQARAMQLALLGNTYIQGSNNGVNWHDNIVSGDAYFRFSSDGGVTWKSLNTDTIREGNINFYYTEARVNANTNVAANTAARHTHSNKSVLDNIVNSGDGTAFLSDDGSYRDIGELFPELVPDEKIKYDASDPSSGYIVDKFVAGSGILLEESESENQLVIINNDAGSDAVSTHEGLYNHDLISTALQSETDPVFTSSDAYNITSTDISNWNGKQDALGFTPEDVANKVTSFQVTPDDTHYPSEKLVKDNLDLLSPASFYANTMTVNAGTLNTGVVGDLQALGGTDVSIQESVGANPLTVTFAFTGITKMTAFVFYGYYNGGSGHQVLIEIYNINTTNWDEIGTIGSESSKHWNAFPIYLPENYINSGAVSVRMRHVETGNSSHNLVLDYLELNYGGSGGSSNVSASSVNFVPSGNISATNVASALIELDNEKLAISNYGFIQVTGLTLSQVSWSLVSGLYEYELSNINITANTVVDIIPDNADIAIVKAAEILPRTDSAAGTVTIYATNEPTDDIGVTINILPKIV